MKTTEIFALCLIVTIVSFMGFVVENVWLAITKGFMDNRNMCLPFLIGYGLAMVAIYLLFGTPVSPRILGRKLSIRNRFLCALIFFLIVMACVSLGEIILGTVVEKSCGIIWWDYTRLPLHITRYTSIPTSMGFAMLITIFMRYFFEPMYDYFLKMNFEDLRTMACGFMTLLNIDFLHNAVRIYKERKMTQLWRVDTTRWKAYKYLHS